MTCPRGTPTALRLFRAAEEQGWIWLRLQGAGAGFAWPQPGADPGGCWEQWMEGISKQLAPGLGRRVENKWGDARLGGAWGWWGREGEVVLGAGAHGRELKVMSRKVQVGRA